MRLCHAVDDMNRQVCFIRIIKPMLVSYSRDLSSMSPEQGWLEYNNSIKDLRTIGGSQKPMIDTCIDAYRGPVGSL